MKRRKWLKIIGWVLLTPILLFIILMILLYVPPIQNFITRKATEIASKATGMDISVGRIDLRFPLNLLVRDVDVVQHADTLLALESLNVKVQLLPLIKGRVEVDNVALKSAKVNSGTLIDGLEIKGELGYFHLVSHGVNLSTKAALVNLVELSDTNIDLILRDTTTTQKPDTASAPVDWKFEIAQLKIDNVAFGMQTPADSMNMISKIGAATIKGGEIDLKDMAFGVKKFMLDNATFALNIGDAKPAPGFDPSHLALKDIKLEIDSLYYQDKNIRALFQQCSMLERSGLAITSLTGQLYSDSILLRVPDLNLKTNHSEIDFTAQTYWELINMPTTGRLAARLNAYIGKQDVMLFLGDLPQDFKDAYPERPLTLHAGTEGNLKQMQITRCKVDLPGAFSLDVGGELYNLTDSLKRAIDVKFDMQTMNLDFLTGLAGMKPGAPLAIPSNMKLDGRFDMTGQQLNAKLALLDGSGSLNMIAALNLGTEVYNADLHISDLQVQHFLPHDSIYGLSADLTAKGRGLDVMSRKAVSDIKFNLEKLQYGKLHFSGLSIEANLKNALATFNLNSDNNLLKATASGDYNLGVNYPDGSVKMNVGYLNLYHLGIINAPLKHDLSFDFDGEIKKEYISANLHSGDMSLKLTTNDGLDKIIGQFSKLAAQINKEFKANHLNLDELKEYLPTVQIDFKAGDKNVLAWYLDSKNMSYEDFTMKGLIEPATGINLDVNIHTFKIDTLQLDTIYLDIKQQSKSLMLDAGVINGPKNPKVAFKAQIRGEVNDSCAQAILDFKDAKGKEALLLGVTMSQRLTTEGKPDGYVFNIIPEQPVIAFQPFWFVDNHNWVYLHKNNRVYANVVMRDKAGMGLRIQSLPSDTTSLQNIDVEIHRLRLQEVFSILPFMPDITGLLNLEAHYIQTEHTLQLSAEANIDSLTYDKNPLGDFTLGATWLPGEKGLQHVSTYLNRDGNEILNADGSLIPEEDKKNKIDVNATINNFPADIANAFIPAPLASLSGDFSGEMHVTGYTDAPLANGEIEMDSLSIYSRQYGARFTLGKEPLRVVNSRLEFNKFAIYTVGNNPFTINGFIDFRDLLKPTADLKLLANNYMLLDAKRTKESLVYGKAAINVDASVRGPLNDLAMRGNIVLLGSTNVTYVLTDSPLSVQDRLSELVTFTNFADTTTVHKAKEPHVALGGLNLAMNVQIEPTAQVKVDLSPDQSSRVQVQGGGDLSLKYTPQGGLALTGRYTISGGTMKYALPVIPLKEFQVVNGSYVEWTGNPADPILNLSAVEKVRTSVGSENGGSRMVLFDISIVVKNTLEDLSLAFNIEAPDDGEVQNQLAMMGPDERQKQAIAMLATGIYLADSGGSGFNVDSALNSVLSSQINSLMGNIKGANISVGIDNTNSAGGANQTDYSFSYSQKFFNDRFQVIIGGKVSTGAEVSNSADSFIDNIRLEYRLDNSATRYLQLFYDKNYESILEGEVTEAGGGIVLRRKMNKLKELFQFNLKQNREDRRKRREEKEMKQKTDEKNAVEPKAIKQEKSNEK